MQVDEADPIWGQVSETEQLTADDFRYNNVRGGCYITSRDGLKAIIQDWDVRDRAKITTWVINRNRLGETPTIDLAAINEIKARSRMQITEKVDRFLVMLEATGFRPGHLLPWRQGVETEASVRERHRTMAWTETVDETEFYSFSGLLIDLGILAEAQGNRVRLTAQALERIESLQGAHTASKQAFVAMWFSEEVAPTYDRGFAAAIRDCGFDPLRIDGKEHANKIDDEIIAEIRRSKFIVADFTCGAITVDGTTHHLSRGGVYYEAGFAQGLGLPVIWSVRSDQIGSVHFDTRQYNHITSDDPDDLRIKLTNRIRAVIF